MAEPVEEMFQEFADKLGARYAASTDTDELIRNILQKAATLDPSTGSERSPG